MLYYYNKEGKFQKESSREYKTEKGAVDRMHMEGQGAVFDETGKMVKSFVGQGAVPEGALDTNTDGSIMVFNENDGLIGTVNVESAAESAGEAGEEPDGQRQPEGKMAGQEQSGKPGRIERAPFDVQTTCDSLRIRSGAGKNYRIVGYIREKNGSKKNHTIVEEKNGWGRLGDVGGWIELAFAKKVS